VRRATATIDGVVRRHVNRRVGPVLSGLVAALACALCPAAPVAAAAMTSGGSVPPKITALHFPHPFIPMQLAATADRIWVLGTTSPHSDTATDCDLEEVAPTTMATRSHPIPACATDIAAAGGRVYLLASEFVPGTAATRQLHLEVFDPRSGEARVLSPVVMSIVGSGIAHTAFAVGDGALWLYGPQMLAGPQVVRISPQTGMVTATFESVPEIGGIYPTVAADGAGLWLGGGPGGAPGLVWVPAATAPATTVYAGSSRSAILWLSAVRNLVWAGVADYAGTGERTTVVTHLVAVDGQGQVAVSSPSEQIGNFPLVPTPGGHLWSLSVAEACKGAEELVAVDPATGSTHPAVALKAPPEACNDADAGAQLAALGHDVFALIPTGTVGSSVLYRADT
jgi:hypothetical protein